MIWPTVISQSLDSKYVPQLQCSCTKSSPWIGLEVELTMETTMRTSTSPSQPVWEISSIINLNEHANHLLTNVHVIVCLFYWVIDWKAVKFALRLSRRIKKCGKARTIARLGSLLQQTPLSFFLMLRIQTEMVIFW